MDIVSQWGDDVVASLPKEGFAERLRIYRRTEKIRELVALKALRHYHFLVESNYRLEDEKERFSAFTTTVGAVSEAAAMNIVRKRLEHWVENAGVSFIAAEFFVVEVMRG